MKRAHTKIINKFVKLLDIKSNKKIFAKHTGKYMCSDQIMEFYTIEHINMSNQYIFNVNIVTDYDSQNGVTHLLTVLYFDELRLFLKNKEDINNILDKILELSAVLLKNSQIILNFYECNSIVGIHNIIIKTFDEYYYSIHLNISNIAVDKVYGNKADRIFESSNINDLLSYHELMPYVSNPIS